MIAGTRKKIIHLLLTAVLLGLAPLSTAVAGNSLLNFFYYNPDSPQNNLGHLKQEMDSFLASFDEKIVFQPFAHFADFDRNVRLQRPAFQLLPDWYLKLYGSQLKLKPLLQPLRSGEASYRKVLLARSGQTTADSLAGRSLAMTPMGPRSAAILDTILFDEMDMNADRLNIVLVPKDSDALFALVLGQVSLALVASDNLKFIAARNPQLVKAVTVVRRSKPLPLPVLCYAEGTVSNEDLARFSKVFQESTCSEQCRNLMGMLRFDGWQTVTH